MSTRINETDVSTDLLAAVIAASVGETYENSDRKSKTYQASVAGTGAVTATVKLWGSNAKTSPNGNTTKATVLSTFTLSGTTTATDGFFSFAGWRFVFGEVTAISGTGAAVTLTQGN